MKRTTLYLDPDLEVLLKLEVRRQRRPMAAIVREAVQAYVTREPRPMPPGAGAWASGHADTAERADDVLAKTGFGAIAGPTRPASRQPRTAGRTTSGSAGKPAVAARSRRRRRA
jgi:hypothetical protein